MSKRTTDTNSKSDTHSKRRRKAPGFRLARSSEADNESQHQSSSRFVTITQNENARVMKGDIRILNTDSNSSITPEPSDSIEPLSVPQDVEFQDNTTIAEETIQPKRTRYTKNADRLREWIPLRHAFLDEVLRHDGLADYIGRTQCSECEHDKGHIKCLDCFDGRMLKCESCIALLHLNLPMHRIERWNGKSFEKELLFNLGVRYQLGHSGSPCPCSISGPLNFIVFDIDGVHRVAIDYCQCHPLPHWQQLMREGWFPATISRPQTAFTFRCLETFHELTLQGKTNLYDYYHTLLRRTDNANLNKTINRFSEIHRVFRMWRHLMALKRAGRGHDPRGCEATSQGELLTECPACPHPDKNLPDNWRNAGPLFLFIAVDGNFKLKGKERNVDDVDLMPGWGAYVNQSDYKSHLANYIDQPELNTCHSQHDAIVRAATRNTPGYVISGVVAVICSRHCMIRRNGVGDLSKGEKYCSVDFIIFATLAYFSLLRLVITYDIICQWSKNFRSRMAEFPEHMHIPEATQVDVAVPGWHINGHGEPCRNNFNLSYLEGAGRTVGEDIETTWAGTNPLAPSVREMGPAARQDTLNDHWNGWNFRKIIGFRLLFCKRLRDAVKMRDSQTDAFNKLTATFTSETIRKWQAMVDKWNANPKSPNPYQEPKSGGATLQDVRLIVLQEEATEAARGRLSRHKVSMASFMLAGFELEDSQYVLRREVAQTRSLRTSKQRADILEKRTALLRLINNWRQVQLAYTPHVATLISAYQQPTESGSENPPEIFPENIPLFLPLSLPPDIRNLPELQKVCKLERRLREPQAEDALGDVRLQRRVIQGLWQFKKLNVSGTGNKPNTRMVDLYKRFEAKTQRAANTYRIARSALTVLDPDGSWSQRLQDLKDGDISGPAREPEDPEAVSSSRYQPSWIWLVPRVSDSAILSEVGINENQVNDYMRVEWAKTRARMKRWQEEVLLIEEEMRRVLVYHEWKATWWEVQSDLRTDADISVLSGIAGYANKQAAISRRIASVCAGYWISNLAKHGIRPSWVSDYEAAHTYSVPEVQDDDEDEDDMDEDNADDELPLD